MKRKAKIEKQLLKEMNYFINKLKNKNFKSVNRLEKMHEREGCMISGVATGAGGAVSSRC